MHLDIQSIKVALREVLCKPDDFTRLEILQSLDQAVDALECIQNQYLLINRDVIKETN